MSQKTRKNAFGTSPLVPNRVQGIQVGSKNQAKIVPNKESKMEGILASIFNAFEWILGGKLGGKTDQKSVQKGIRKRMEKITMQERRILLQKSTARVESAWVRLTARHGGRHAEAPP